MAVPRAAPDGVAGRVRRCDARRAQARGRTRRDRGARQGRLGRRARAVAAARGRGRAVAARVAVGTARPARGAARAADPVGVRQPAAAARLPQGVHGRDARLGNGVDARRLGRADHERRGARRRSSLRRGGGRVPRCGACDRRPREPRGARRVRAHARGAGSRSGCGSGSSMRSCSRRTTCRASPRSASQRRCSSRTRPPTATSPTGTGPAKTDGAYAYRSLWDSGAVVANGSDAPIEELDPLAGIRAGVRRTIDARGRVASERGDDRPAGVRGDVASRRRGSRARSGAAAGCCPGSRPISSCSTAIRGTTSTRRSWRRWSPAGGCTTRRRGTDPPVTDMSEGSPSASPAFLPPTRAGALTRLPLGATLPVERPRACANFATIRPQPSTTAVARTPDQSAANVRYSSRAVAIPSGT